MLTYPHPPSPTAVRSTNRLRLRGSISGPWSARPEWAPTAVSFLGCNAFLLALAFRDAVFVGISSPADLWDFRVPEGEPQLELRIHPSKLDLPVLRTVTRHGGLSDRMLDDSTFRYYFQRTVLNAGYYGEFTIYTLRRAVANEVDSEVP